MFLLQVVTLWLQYMSLLGNIGINVPGSVHWVFSIATFAFSSITSGSLSTDCLIRAGLLRPALQRLLLHLAVPLINLVLLAALQLIWYGCNTWVPCVCMSAVLLSLMHVAPVSVQSTSQDHYYDRYMYHPSLNPMGMQTA